MNDKVKKYISISLLIIMVFGFIFIGTRNYDKEKVLSDNEKMAEDYKGLGEDNIFDILNNSEMEEFKDNGTGILYLANPDSKWGQKYTLLLNDIVKKSNIKEIKYYNIKHAKETLNRHYANLVEKLEGNLFSTDESDNNLFTPMAIFLKNGKVIGVNNKTAIMSNNVKVDDYWTPYNINIFNNEINELINKLMEK